MTKALPVCRWQFRQWQQCVKRRIRRKPVPNRSAGGTNHPPRATLVMSTIMRTVTGYVHGYGTPEQERLVEQAEHWRHRLIRDGSQLERDALARGRVRRGRRAGGPRTISPGTRLTSVKAQAAGLRSRASRAGRVEATLLQTDARELPFEDESFDHVWMMWFLERRRSACRAA